MSWSSRLWRVHVALLAGVLLPAAAAAQGDTKLKLSGDARLRVERDWDSRNSDGSLRPDRDRLRGRLRFGFTYALDDVFSFGGRVRTGEAPQSSQATLGDGFRPKEVDLDQLFVTVTRGGFWSWGGKNVFPFWKPNEIFWDDDVLPEGVAAGYRWGAGGRAKLGLAGACFVLDNALASRNFGDLARLLAGQAHLAADLRRLRLNAALGLFAFRDNPEGDTPALGGLEPTVVVFSLRADIQGLGRPLSLSFDVLENVADLPAALVNRTQTSGYTAAAAFGGLGKRGEWLAAVTYAHVEEHAVVPAFAQDDWLRWGSATQARGSNFGGFELRLGLALRERVNLVLRYYDVEGLVPRSAQAAALETGKRVRLDLNLGF